MAAIVVYGTKYDVVIFVVNVVDVGVDGDIVDVDVDVDVDVVGVDDDIVVVVSMSGEKIIVL